VQSPGQGSTNGRRRSVDEVNKTLGDLARVNPAATRVFWRRRLDFCCGGKRTLVDACAAAGLDAATIAREIAEETAREADPAGWDERSQAELADHIESRYHAGLRSDFPSLITAARRVEKVHAGKPDVPAGLGALLAGLWAELQTHMDREEAILFPMIRQGARGEQVYTPVRLLELEHELHGRDLTRIRQLTGDLTPPASACATWTALYRGLESFEKDLMDHVHLENNVLFFRAIRGS
jgi:regulator of cell morphogenesis and NO signaling